VPAGSPPFTYQWQYNGQSIPGATSASVVLTGVTNSAGIYTVFVGNSLGSVTGTVVMLKSMASGAIFNDTFVRGISPGPISPWVAAVGGWTVTGQKLISTNLSTNLGNAYVTGTNWGDYSVQANVCFPAGGASAYGGGIGGHLNPGTGARYAAWVYPESSPGGTAALNLVKFTDWVNWSGTSLQLSPITLGNGVGTNWHNLNLSFRQNEIIAYWDGIKVVDVVDQNSSNLPPFWIGGITADLWANSAAQAMMVSNVVVSDSPAFVVTQPVSVSTLAGATVAFSVIGSGTPPLTYQWLKNGLIMSNGGNVTGADTSILTLVNVSVTDIAPYQVVLSDIYGSVTSSIVNLSFQNCTAPPSGLISWWPGDGNANDIIGTNNGILLGGATATVAGMVQQSFNFNGTNNYVRIADSPTLRPTNLTIEAWVKFSNLETYGSGLNGDGINPGHQYIVFKQNTRSSNFEGYSLGKDRYSFVPHPPQTNGDVFYFDVSSADGTQTAEADSAVTIATNVWYHIAGVRGPNFVQLYVNGQLQMQASVSFPQNYGSLPVYFGTSGQSYWDGKLAGQLDEVSIYNRALSSNEIAVIYRAGMSGKCKGTSVAGNPPVILSEPVNQAVIASNTATFSVGISGDLPLACQWYFNTTNPVGLRTNVLSLTNVQLTNAGIYSVMVANLSGSRMSSNANLFVLSKQPSLRSENPVSNKLVSVVFNTQTGPTYYLEYENSLVGSNWQVVTNVAGTGGSQFLDIPITSEAMRFFRLRVQ